MIPIRLTISGKQTEHGAEPRTIRITTEGKLYQRETCKVIAYRESEQSGYGKTLTILKIHDAGHIDLTRSGESNSKMSFNAGERQMTDLFTPAGIITIGVLTHEVKADIQNDQGSVRIHYALDYSNQSPVDMLLELKYHALESAHDDIH